jgi:hypothetical protein
MITPEVTLNMPAQSLVPGTTHTYSDSLGQEVDNLVAVDASRLQPLLPPGYVIVPASNFFGVGRANQGVVAIVNFRGMHPLIDGISVLDNDVAIDVGIVVAEPAAAAGAGLSIPGAFHLYTLAIYTNDPLYAVVLFADAMPVQYVPGITYQRNMDDATGVGVVTVNVPNLGSPFMTVTTGYGYALATGALDAVFWHNSLVGQTALHFHDIPYRIGNAAGQVYVKPQSWLAALLNDGGSGACPPDPTTGYACVVAPSFNLHFDNGGQGTLLLIQAK